MTIKNAPNKSGLYLARSIGFEWWNLVVDIYGDVPFFQVKVYDRANDSVFEPLSVSDIYEFGPEIDTTVPVSLDKSEHQ